MRLIASNCVVPSTKLVDLYEKPDGQKFNWDEVFPGFNNGNSEFRRKCLAVAINDASTEITSTLDCDTAKVSAAYNNRDPRLCWECGSLRSPITWVRMPVPIPGISSL